jgi:hypothetical protein
MNFKRVNILCYNVAEQKQIEDLGIEGTATDMWIEGYLDKNRICYFVKSEVTVNGELLSNKVKIYFDSNDYIIIDQDYQEFVNEMPGI